jgi:tetratricopeptide (TPR) repeat protein
MSEEKKYQQEVLEWQLEQIHMREKYANTPAGFATPEKAARAKHHWEDEMESLRKFKRRDLQSGYRPTKEFFAGRQAELDAIAAALEQGSGPVVLYGVGGIGKSAMARAFARKNAHLYDHVLLLHFSGSIQEMIVNDFELKISNLHYNENLYHGRRAYFREKYKIFLQIAKEMKLLLIVDSCSVRKDNDMQKLFDLPCDILITSRLDPKLWMDAGCRCTGIYVGPLSTDEEWYAFIEGYRKKPLTVNEFTEWKAYRDKIQGHTLLMQLKICNPNLDMESKREFGMDLLTQFSLKKTEKEVLTYLSFLPQQGIPLNLFYQITGCSQTAVRHLKEYMLIEQRWDANWQEDMIGMHPVFAEAAREIFQPGCRNCNHFINGLADYLSDRTEGGCTWVRTYEENQRLEPYVFAVIRTFSKPEPWLAESFYLIVTFLWIQCYFKEAEQYALKLYKAVETYYGSQHQMTGYIACRTSAVYYNRMDFEKALLWGEKGYRILQECEPADAKYDFYVAAASERLAKLYWYGGRHREALQMIDQVFACLERAPKEKTPLRYYYAVLLKSKFLFQMGKIDQAVELFETEIIRARDIDGLWDSDAGAGMEFRGNEFRSFYVSLLVAKNQLEKAYQMAKVVVENAMRYRGEQFKDSLSGMEQLGDICASLDKKSEACNWYGTIIACIEENYPYQTEWRNRVLDKLAAVW